MEPDPSVLVLHNTPRPGSGAGGGFAESDAGVLAEVEAVAAGLESLGIPFTVAGVRETSDLARILAGSRESIVFNLVESFHRRPVEANLVPAFARAFGKACTGSDWLPLVVSLDKHQTKRHLEAAGLPGPPGTVVHVGAEAELSRLPEPPCIVKPAGTDASEGIDGRSIFHEIGPDLAEAVAEVHRRFGQPALVEAFVGGREINVSILERAGRPGTLPLAEIDFSAFGPGKPRIVDYAAKWLTDSFEYNHTPRLIPAPLSDEAARRVREHALAAWRALGCNDYVRVDFRLDDEDRPFILEINANPDISPDAGFAAALAAAKIPYASFVRTVVENAAARGR